MGTSKRLSTPTSVETDLDCRVGLTTISTSATGRMARSSHMESRSTRMAIGRKATSTMTTTMGLVSSLKQHVTSFRKASGRTNSHKGKGNSYSRPRTGSNLRCLQTLSPTRIHRHSEGRSGLPATCNTTRTSRVKGKTSPRPRTKSLWPRRMTPSLKG